MLMNGLAPGIAEGAEVAVHFVKTGHIAHTFPGENDLGNQGREHSCGVIFHRCSCCAPMTVVASGPADVVEPMPVEKDCSTRSLARGAHRSLEPPFRPPIR